MKRIRIAEFKARLSEYLRYVKRGHGVTILDRDTPIAQVLPLTSSAGIVIHASHGEHRSLADVPMPPPLRLRRDPLELLADERQRDR